MNNNLKKLMALMLALSMCASLMTVPAVAAEGDAATESVITIPEAPGDGSAEKPAVTVDVTIQENGNTTTTITQTDWSGETKVPSETGEGANDGTTTTVTGSQTATETVEKDSQDRVTKETGHVEGSENTKTETVETDVTKDVIIYENTVDINESTGPVTIPENPKTVWETNEDGTEKWIEGEEIWETNEDGTEKWNNGTEVPVTGEDTDSEGWKETGNSAGVGDLPDPLDAIDVTLELSPGKTDQESFEVTKEILANDPAWNAFDFGVIDALKADKDGKIETTEGNKKIVKEAIYGEADEAGNRPILGYKITTTTTTPEETYDPTDVQEGAAQEKEPMYAAPAYPSDADDKDYVIKDDDGNVIEGIQTEVEEIKDDNGKVIGYRITKTTTTPGGGTVPSEATGKTTSVDAPVQTDFTLPDKPAESEKTENGMTTKVVVENAYDENGKHVGYTSVTVRTDALSGKELYRAAETIYGTTTTINKTTTTDPTRQEVITDTTKVTTEVTEIYGYQQTKDVALTQERTTNIKTTEVTDSASYQLVTTDAGVYFLYKGEMYRVIAQGNHGDVTMTSLVPSQQMPTAGSFDTGNELYHRTNSDALSSWNTNGWDYQWLGKYGLESMIRVNTTGTGQYDDTYQAHQFVLVDEAGNEHYVYCADFEVNPQEGFRYGMENVEDASYYNSAAAQHIRAIAANGYWGTTEGVGSLAAVKKLMKDATDSNGTAIFDQTEIDDLTAGEALTATQAAIWHFGNSGDDELNDRDIVGAYYYPYGSEKVFNHHYTNKTVQKLYDYLITLTESPSSGTVLITENNFATDAAITILDKNATHTNNQDDDPDNDVYDTNVKFTLAVVPTANDELIVRVMVGDETVKSVRLTDKGDKNLNKAVRNGDGSYTIENIQLAENVNITLNLQGTQQLEQGVYLYTSEIRTDTSDLDKDGDKEEDIGSQTFVGIGSGTRNVNLTVAMNFEVEEPTAEKSTVTKEKNETRKDFRNGSREDTRFGTMSSITSSSVTTGTETTIIYADVTVTETTITETGREWTEDWEKTYSYTDPIIDPPTDPVGPTDPDIPDDPIPEAPEEDIEIPEEEPPVVDIPDKEIALEDVPKTGDVSLLALGLTSLLSGGGLVGLVGMGRKGKEEA